MRYNALFFAVILEKHGPIFRNTPEEPAAAADSSGG